jgi:6-phosphogluconolactonase
LKKIIWSVVLSIVLISGLAIGFTTAVVAAGPDSSGAAFAMTNAKTGNAIVMFGRDGHGMLTMKGSVPTQGMGNGDSSSPLDPVGSQGSLVLSDDGQWLLAANAGSNDISLFRVERDGLKFMDKVGSGGVMPISIAISGRNVFVLNQGSANIAGFMLTPKGQLVAMPEFTRVLPGASPVFSQVGFNGNGQWLVVTDRGDTSILVFSLAASGMPAATPVISPSSGGGPFGFIFDARGHLLVVEAGANAVSSYDIMPDGSLSVISASVPNGQIAACWIVGNRKGDIFTTNPGTGTVSSYAEMVFNGQVVLRNGVAASDPKPLDIGMSNNGQFLYALNPIAGGIDMFKVDIDGGLISLGSVAGGFAVYAQGIAVK